MFTKTVWKYKAEGNKHVVVADGYGNCLRLIKANQIFHHSYLHNKILSDISSVTNQETAVEENQDELAFLKHVVLPLINCCDACHIPKVIKLPEVLLRNIAKQIEFHRPKFRKHQSIDYTARSLLMNDYCFISSTKKLKDFIESGGILDANVYAVELKLKNGFLKGYTINKDNFIDTQSVCQFCKTQMFRVIKQKRYEKCSMYCPLDIFSADQHKMKKALYSLLLNPQNNLRLFHNGDVVYSQETLDSCRSCCSGFSANLTTDNNCIVLLKDMFKFVLKNKIDSESIIDPETLVHIVIKALLIPVVSKNFADMLRNENCHGSYYKTTFCSDANDFIDLNNCVTNPVNYLKSNCILGLILSLQNLDKCCLSDVVSNLQLLELFLSNHIELKDDLSVDAPYDSSGWSSFSQEPYHCKKVGKHQEIYEASHRLRQFFVAKSFNDCSVMISFQKVMNMAEYKDNQSNQSAEFNVIEHEGNFFVLSIAVVDTDPKYTGNMPVYLKKYKEISDWWENFLQINSQN